MSDIAVRVEGLGKRFNLSTAAETSLYETLSLRMRAIQKGMFGWMGDGNLSTSEELPATVRAQDEDFWALKDINFELKHGEVLGVVGQNGAGKSTLLKILAQVLIPTTGRAELHGNVGALLEVGTGFNPELSGRENIFLYGSILGMSRADIRKRFDEIVDFAEIERFLDQPIKHYSSGMHSRLGFSVAAHLECDILLVDEVLAVGDAKFQAKCLGKMQDVTGQGRAVIFVSHNMSAVNNMCQTGIVLIGGRLVFSGKAPDATAHYMASVMPVCSQRANPISFTADPSKPVQIRECLVSTKAGEPTLSFERTEAISVRLKVDVIRPSADYFVAIILHDAQGNCLIHALDDDEGPSILANADFGRYTVTATIPAGIFKVGEYSLTVAISRHKDGRIDKHDHLLAFEIKDTRSAGSMRGRSHLRNLIAPMLDWHVTTADEPLS